MLTKTSIALAIIVAICSSTVAAQAQHHGVRTDNRGPGQVLINRCATWDSYGLRCDSASE
jgi:hypothetical protein